MKWVKAILFVLACCAVPAIISGVLQLPPLLAFLLSMPFGACSMVYAIEKWRLI